MLVLAIVSLVMFSPSALVLCMESTHQELSLSSSKFEDYEKPKKSSVVPTPLFLGLTGLFCFFMHHLRFTIYSMPFFLLFKNKLTLGWVTQRVSITWEHLRDVNLQNYSLAALMECTS